MKKFAKIIALCAVPLAFLVAPSASAFASGGRHVHGTFTSPKAHFNTKPQAKFNTNQASLGTAPTCTAANLAAAQSIVEQKVTNRVNQLVALANRITDDTDIPASDASVLSGIVSTEQTGITDGGIDGLGAVVASATDCQQLLADASTMVDSFRVFAVVSPQVDLTALASTESTIASQLAALEPNIQAAIAGASSTTSNASTLQSDFSQLQADVLAAQTQIGQVTISQLLTQTPSDYPADQSLFGQDHADLSQAGSDLHSANLELRQILSDLT
jgi:hypothetical protein